VDESQALMRVMDRLRADKEMLLRGGLLGITTNGTALGAIGIGQEKKMRVCETCGAFLVVGDTEKRMASHLEGKQHQGYHKIRQAIDEYHKRKEEEHRARRASGGGGRDSFRAGGDRERERERERDRERDRDRLRERDRPFNDSNRGGRDSRDRERERDRGGERERDRGGERERDRGGERERDRGGERERDRGGRDGSRGYRDDRKRPRDEDR
jgi:hypothetical protein